MSPWAVASGGCTPEVKELALKGTVRRYADRQEARHGSEIAW